MVTPKAAKRSDYSFMGVEIEINHDCNRTCAYCPNSLTKRKHQGRMSEGLFLRVLEQLKELDYCGRISYHFYNEPLLSPDLDRFVALTRTYLPRCWIELYSNGTLLDEQRLMALIDRGVDRFIVTKHHGSPGYAFGDLYGRLDPATRDKIKFQTYKEVHLTNRGGLVKVGRAGKKPPLDLPCLIPSCMLVVTVNGNVLPCYEDYGEENVMGNIGESTLMEIWNSRRYRQFRIDLKSKKRALYPVCKDCNSALIIN